MIMSQIFSFQEEVMERLGAIEVRLKKMEKGKGSEVMRMKRILNVRRLRRTRTSTTTRTVTLKTRRRRRSEVGLDLATRFLILVF